MDTGYQTLIQELEGGRCEGDLETQTAKEGAMEAAEISQSPLFLNRMHQRLALGNSTDEKSQGSKGQTKAEDRKVR